MGKALLIIVLGFSVIFSSIMFNLTSNHQRSANKMAYHYDKWIAQNAASSAANAAISKIYQNFNWRTGYSNLSFFGANYSVTITDIPVDSTTEAKKLQVTAIATYGDKSDTTVSVFMQPAYSYYYYYVNTSWHPSLKYEDGDTLIGPIHSNSMIRIKKNPVFIGRVSSSQDSFQNVGSADPKFYGGAEFGTQNIPLPDLSGVIGVAQAGGDVYNEELWLTFNFDGSYSCSTSTIDTLKFISDFNGTIMTTNGKKIHVKGVVNGKVTVISDRDILIEDNIVYAEDPRSNPNSDDYLGLIAAHRVTVRDNVPNSNDVEIHAAIIARHDELMVENYDTGPPRGTLTILGSIVQNNAFPYGTYHEGGLETGYEGNHIYDARLMDKTPPFFPRLDRVERVFRSD